MPLLEVQGLTTTFNTPKGPVAAVDGVDFCVDRGEVLGIVGESGCGKSVTSLSVLRLVPNPPGRITGGSVRFDGQELLSLPEEQMRKVRGNRISMIFQEPMTALNPVFTVGNQIGEGLRLHRGLSRHEARERSVEMLERVGIPAPRMRVDEYPHQLSGGMRQRVMIAMAIACEPDLLFADEPTTALDVTIQAQILALLSELRERTGMALVMISHDLGVIAETADRVAIMYAGRVVEETTTTELFRAPMHPYTQGLLASLPRVGQGSKGRLAAIPGTVPALTELGPGCKFRDRCTERFAACDGPEPPLTLAAEGHSVRCHLYARAEARA
ncbi:MAG: ABC transporter ATP-binding protein [Nitrospirota bacterium]|nr:ABC transporter ATP-binding protein [Nitrospirota bacterium]